MFLFLFHRTQGVKGVLDMGQEHGGQFQKHTSYILQDDNLYPWFTVQEAMSVAANLKISKDCMNHDEKQNLVK